MKSIPMELVNEFNKELRKMNSIIKLYKSGGYSIDIKLLDDGFLNMDNQIINPNKEFYQMLEDFFNKNGFNITYNNTRSCFWSVS